MVVGAHGSGSRGVLVTSPTSTSAPRPLGRSRPSHARAAGVPEQQRAHEDSQWPTLLRPRRGPWWCARGVHRPRVVRGTMAPDKSAMVSNLNHLLSLDSAASPTANPSAASGRSSSSASVPRAPKAVATLSPLPQPAPDDDYHPSDGWQTRSHHLQQRQLWERIREEAALDAVLEPALATHLHSVILSHRSMDSAMAFLLANKLADGMLLGAVQLMSLIREVYAADPSILAAAVADMNAVLDRDPACAKYSQCMLQFKGYQAVQVYRITHFLWQQGRQPLALALQSRVSELFSVDIHPAAQLGRGVMLDHATGIVIGETAVVGDNVSMLHHVSLGGSGTGRNVRHPRVGHGVLLGAGVAVVGPVTIGAGSKVGAGSVVVSDLPAHCVAVGVPARIVKRDIRDEPVKEMDQVSEFVLDFVI